MKKTFFILSAALVFLMSSCKKEEEAAPKSLYDRLGGVSAISAVVDQFITNVAADPNMVRTFTPLLTEVGKGNTARLTALRNNLIDQMLRRSQWRSAKIYGQRHGDGTQRHENHRYRV